MTTTTIRKNQFGEYHVRVRENGIRKPERDYFTDNKKDAEVTAKFIREEKVKNVR